MRRVVMLFVFAFAFFCGHEAAAQGNTANDLAESCRLVVNATPNGSATLLEAGKAGTCLGYFQSFQETLSFFGGVFCPQYGPKLPKGVTTGQLIRVFLKYADGHPEILHEPAGAVVLSSVMAAFPSPKATKPHK